MIQDFLGGRLRAIALILSALSAQALSGCGSSQPDASDPPAASSTAASTASSTAARQRDEAIRWRLSSTYPSSLPLIGTSGKKLAERLAVISGGAIRLQFFEPGVLAPPFETFDAVSVGAVEAAWSTSGYWAGKEPALQLFSAIPFGPAAPEYLAWFDHGGGRPLFEKLYQRHNIYSLICGVSAPEASGWFNKPIETADDFRNLKIRFFGLGGKVLEKLGASPQLLAGGEIFQALELGVIDASEFSMPAVDVQMGFDEVARYYHFPGWHQQSTFYELLINLDIWRSLSATQQAQFEHACSSNIRFSLSEAEAAQLSALQALEGRGVRLQSLNSETLSALRGAWEETATELSAAHPRFAAVYQSLLTFRAAYKQWSDLGYLKQ